MVNNRNIHQIDKFVLNKQTFHRANLSNSLQIRPKEKTNVVIKTKTLCQVDIQCLFSWHMQIFYNLVLCKTSQRHCIKHRQVVKLVKNKFHKAT